MTQFSSRSCRFTCWPLAAVILLCGTALRAEQPVVNPLEQLGQDTVRDCAEMWTIHDNGELNQKENELLRHIDDLSYDYTSSIQIEMAFIKSRQKALSDINKKLEDQTAKAVWDAGQAGGATGLSAITDSAQALMSGASAQALLEQQKIAEQRLEEFIDYYQRDRITFAGLGAYRANVQACAEDQRKYIAESSPASASASPPPPKAVPESLPQAAALTAKGRMTSTLNIVYKGEKLPPVTSATDFNLGIAPDGSVKISFPKSDMILSGSIASDGRFQAKVSQLDKGVASIPSHGLWQSMTMTGKLDGRTGAGQGEVHAAGPGENGTASITGSWQTSATQ